MGKKKSCDVSTRGVIIKLYKEKKTYREIADLLKCSKRMVFNAVSHFKTHGSIENVPRKLRPRKTSSRTDNRIVKLAKVNPHMSAVEIHKGLFDENSAPSSKIAVRTVRKRLQDAGLHGRIARKKPLLSKKHRQARIQFAKKYGEWTVDQWRHVLFSDETKVNRIGSDGKTYVRRPVGKEFNPKYTTTTVKHGGGSVMVWGCFSHNGTGPIHQKTGNLDRFQYISIMEDVMLPFADGNLSVL